MLIVGTWPGVLEARHASMLGRKQHRSRRRGTAVSALATPPLQRRSPPKPLKAPTHPSSFQGGSQHVSGPATLQWVSHCKLVLQPLYSTSVPLVVATSTCTTPLPDSSWPFCRATLDTRLPSFHTPPSKPLATFFGRKKRAEKRKRKEKKEKKTPPAPLPRST